MVTWAENVTLFVIGGKHGGGQESKKDCKKQTDEVRSDPVGTEQRL